MYLHKVLRRGDVATPRRRLINSIYKSNLATSTHVGDTKIYKFESTQRHEFISSNQLAIYVN